MALLLKQVLQKHAEKQEKPNEIKVDSSVPKK